MGAFSRNHLVFALCAASFSGSSALAQDQPQPPRQGFGDGQQGPHRQPPEAAFTACSELKEDDVCEVELQDRTIQGKCVPGRDEARLVCLPDRPPPPPEARSVCNGKATGDSCTLALPDGKTLPRGVCTEGSQEGLFCRPSKSLSE
jgi:hypothetical protein